MYDAHHYRHLLNPFERCMKRSTDITSFWLQQFGRCGFRLSSVFYSGVHTFVLIAMVMLTATLFLNATYTGIGGLANGFILFIVVSLISAHAVSIYTKNGIDTLLGMDKDFGHDGLPAPIQKQAVAMYVVRKALEEMGPDMLVSTLSDGSFNQTVQRKAKEMELYVTSNEKDEALNELMKIAEEHGRFIGNFLWAIEAIVLSSLAIVLVV